MMNLDEKVLRCLFWLIAFAPILSDARDVAGDGNGVKLIPVDSAWAANSVNVVVFRKNSLASYKKWQYTAFYDANKFVVVAKRKKGSSKWQIRKTGFKGNAADAHNTISIMVDGDGYLHMAFDHHNNPLNYCRSVKPGSLEMTAKMPMTGSLEEKVSYPEFYYLASGDMLFFFRNGGSGRGDLVVNYYETKTKNWKQLHRNLVDGEGKRNAYWQACTDSRGSIHLSWVWRESPDVASNHDMCYARSDDNGVTWVKSTGEKYQLPVKQETAEYAWNIQQNSELINQTSMYADANGNPFIATYWRNAGDSVPQYRVVYKMGNQWQVSNLGFRKTPFSLSGMGTKRIPIARPQIITDTRNGSTAAFLVFRDEERGSKVSLASTADITAGEWRIIDLTEFSVGSWEPTYDTEKWKRQHKLNLFVQNVEQADAEGITNIPPRLVYVLEWDPNIK